MEAGYVTITIEEYKYLIEAKLALKLIHDTMHAYGADDNIVKSIDFHFFPSDKTAK